MPKKQSARQKGRCGSQPSGQSRSRSCVADSFSWEASSQASNEFRHENVSDSVNEARVSSSTPFNFCNHSPILEMGRCSDDVPVCLHLFSPMRSHFFPRPRVQEGASGCVFSCSEHGSFRLLVRSTRHNYRIYSEKLCSHS